MDGSHLASITSDEENRILSTVAEQYDDQIWIGGSDIASEGDWVWSDETTWSYSNWHSDEPSNDKKKEHCLTFQRHWNDDDCTHKFPFLCQKRICPFGWTLFESNCYKVFDIRGSWNAARKLCRSHDAQLASVHSHEENRFLLSFAGTEENWLGGSDLIEEGVWQWTDNTPWDYSNWREGEPSDPGVESCLELKGLKWNDESCGLNRKHCICKTTIF